MSESFQPPAGLTAQKTAEILEAVARRIVMSNPRKYVFGYNSAEDIIQHGIYKGLECIAEGKYHPEKHIKEGAEGSPEISLIRFMSIHIRNRLINYKRDESRRAVDEANDYAANNTKHSLMNPILMGDHEGPGVVYDYSGVLECEEIIERIRGGLRGQPEMLMDFGRLIDGAFIPSQRKSRLRQKIGEILGGRQYGAAEEEGE